MYLLKLFGQWLTASGSVSILPHSYRNSKVVSSGGVLIILIKINNNSLKSSALTTFPFSTWRAEILLYYIMFRVLSSKARLLSRKFSTAAAEHPEVYSKGNAPFPYFHYLFDNNNTVLCRFMYTYMYGRQPNYAFRHRRLHAGMHR